jgi:hypothetical protein
MLIKKIALFILVILAPSADIYTQKMNPSSGAVKKEAGYDIKFTQISIVEGLSQSTVYSIWSIYEDRRGFPWISTNKGTTFTIKLPTLKKEEGGKPV